MRKQTLIISAALACAMCGNAQTLYIGADNVYTAFPASETGDMFFSGNPASVVIAGQTYSLEAYPRILADNREIADNTVTVTYSGSSARVDVAANIAEYVSATVAGAHVGIVQSSDVSESTCGEITYILKGASSDGGLTLDGSYKCSLLLAGLDLSNPDGAAIDIQNGKRIELKMESGTDNLLADGVGGSWKGAVVCKGHLEIKGKGSLTVTGNTSHAIYAKEYVEMKNATVTVVSAVKDGLNCAQYLNMESGSLNILASGDDGVQVSFKDDEDREAEDTGSIFISGGQINISTTAAACKALKADGNVFISGGELDLSVSGNGVWDSSKVKTKAAACISADGDVEISGGTISLTATGSGGKGVSCDGTFRMTDGDMTVATSGGIYAYVNGREYINYTGNTDYLDSDAKSSPKGIKADTEIVISGGVINVSCSGNGGEGIESKGILTIEGGRIYAETYDDCINSSSHMYIKGGEITVISSGNDGLDSNGNLCVEGGYIMAFGTSAPECGIDANEEDGYTVIFTGGVLLAVGGSNSVPGTDDSTQPYVSGSGSVSAGSVVTLADGDEILATFSVPEAYAGSKAGSSFGPGGMFGGGGVLVTCPGLVSGSKYTLNTGSASTSVTAALKGSSSGGPGGRPW